MKREVAKGLSEVLCESRATRATGLTLLASFGKVLNLERWVSTIEKLVPYRRTNGLLVDDRGEESRFAFVEMR